MGEEGKEIYYANELNKKKLNDQQILEELEKVIVQEENVITNRFKFQMYNKESTQKFADYLLELKKLHIKANYENVKPDEILRDKIVQGIVNKRLQKELLKLKDPTLAKVVQVCYADEAAKLDQNIMSEATVETEEKVVYKQEFQECKFCGIKHEFVKGKCPAWNKECRKCGRKNHFQKCCTSRERVKRENKVIYEQEIEEIKQLRESSKGLYKVLAVRNRVGMPGRHNILLDCYLDTGACTNIIGYRELCNVLNVKQVKLEPSKV